MMNRGQAIQSINLIQHGSGLNREHFPDEWKAQLAQLNWNNGLFGLGMEYGYILAMMDAFDITPDDLP